MCGPAKRIWHLSPDKMFREGEQTLDLQERVMAYDAALKKVSLAYCNQMHNLITNNCHSHVASLLNEIHYDGRSDWNQFRVFRHLWHHGRWVHKSSAVWTFVPFAILTGIIVILSCVFALKS